MSLIIEDITFKEYFTLNTEDKAEYDFAMKYAKIYTNPIDVFGLGDITERTFGFVKDVQQDVIDGLQWDKLIKYIIEITDKTEKEIANFKLLTISRFITYLVDEVVRVNEIEKQLLFHAPDNDEVEAGLDNFAQFGNYAQFRKLAREDILKIEQVRLMRYDACLLELYYQKETAEYLQRHHNIKSRK